MCISPVQQGTIHDGVAEVQGVAGVVVQVEVQCNQLALLGEAHL